MTSYRCESCGGTGAAPWTLCVSSCQFCHGQGWLVDPMTLDPAPEPAPRPIHTYTRTPEEIAAFETELERRYSA